MITRYERFFMSNPPAWNILGTTFPSHLPLIYATSSPCAVSCLLQSSDTPETPLPIRAIACAKRKQSGRETVPDCRNETTSIIDSIIDRCAETSIIDQCGEAWATRTINFLRAAENVQSRPVFDVENPCIPSEPHIHMQRRGIKHAKDLRPQGFCRAHIDGSLILSMERTLYAALNQAWMLVLCGIGLMSIGAANNSIPDELGFYIIAAAIVFAVGNYVVHVSRLHAFSNGRPLRGLVSIVWTGMLVAVIVGALILELHYAVLYPYLERAKAVEILNSNMTIN